MLSGIECCIAKLLITKSGCAGQVLYMGGDVGGARDDGLDVVNLMHGRKDVPGMEVCQECANEQILCLDGTVTMSLVACSRKPDGAYHTCCILVKVVALLTLQVSMSCDKPLGRLSPTTLASDSLSIQRWSQLLDFLHCYGSVVGSGCVEVLR